MADYEPPVDDKLFCIGALCSSPKTVSHSLQKEFSDKLVLAVLNSASKSASEVLAPLNGLGDQYESA